MSEAIGELSVNKLLAGAIITLLSWNIYTTYKLTIDVAVLTEKIERMERAIYSSQEQASN